MQQDGCEKKHLHLGDLVSDAASLPWWENHHAVGEVFIKVAVFIQESRGVEDVGVLPLQGVVVDGPLVDEDHRVFGNAEAFDGDVRGGGVRDGDGDEAGEAHGLVDEGVQVGQAASVLDGWQSVLAHHFVHKLMQFGLHVWVFDQKEDDPLHDSGNCVLTRPNQICDCGFDKLFGQRAVVSALDHIDHGVAHVSSHIGIKGFSVLHHFIFHKGEKLLI